MFCTAHLPLLVREIMIMCAGGIMFWTPYIPH